MNVVCILTLPRSARKSSTSSIRAASSLSGPTILDVPCILDRRKEQCDLENCGGVTDAACGTREREFSSVPALGERRVRKTARSSAGGSLGVCCRTRAFSAGIMSLLPTYCTRVWTTEKVQRARLERPFSPHFARLYVARGHVYNTGHLYMYMENNKNPRTRAPLPFFFFPFGLRRRAVIFFRSARLHGRCAASATFPRGFSEKVARLRDYFSGKRGYLRTMVKVRRGRKLVGKYV